MSRRTYDWAAVVARAQRRPLVWLLVFPDHPASLVDAIRGKDSRLLARPDGHLEATGVNRYRVPGFAEQCDIWVRWVPKDLEGTEPP